MSDETKPIRLIPPTDYRLNMELNEYFGIGHSDPEVDRLTLQVLPKFMDRGMTMVGHLVTAKDVDLARFLSKEEIEFVRSRQEKSIGIPRDARVPRWNAPDMPQQIY